ncbi:MAG: LytTR family DNA-binding domain-containing protein [Lachnospiraceae bacterium]|nr:LytTR family DNA-binding domain-containing protein [Lachnospiraceae bacterium]
MMFKITIKQIDKSREEEIIVNCHEIDDEVVSIVNMLRKSENVLLGSRDNKTFRIPIKDIFYIESVDNKTFIYLIDAVYESKQKLYELEELLSGTKLFRCSKSMILNIAKIRSVSPSVNGRFEARLTNNENVIISRQYVPNLKKRLGM